MIPSDGVVMRDRAARSDDRIGGRGLDRLPLRELFRFLTEREHREVGRGTVGVDVREPARRKAPASQTPSVVDPQEIARIQNAADERLKKSEAEWELERTRLT